MESAKFQEKMTNITEKIGEEKANLILDDIGILLTDNQEMNKTLENKNKEIEDLKKRNETLQTVNGNLLQQIPMADDNSVKEQKEDKPKTFDFKDAFDEKRKF